MFPEGTRCGRVCEESGQGHDHSPTETFVKGKSRKRRTHESDGEWLFVPSSDAVCTCGHQYSWPRMVHDYDGYFRADAYYGSYCEWTYGAGPMENYQPVTKEKRAAEPRLDAQYGAGKQAAQYLAVCAPVFCNADMFRDTEVFDVTLDIMLAWIEYAEELGNGKQFVQYSVNGEEFTFDLLDLNEMRELDCPSSGLLKEDGTKVKIGTECSIRCKPGHMFLPDDSRSDTVKCIGQPAFYGLKNGGAWHWMLEPKLSHPGFAGTSLDLKVCVPNNYADRD